MAQTECIVRVIGQNKFDLSIDSVNYAMILSTDMRHLTSSFPIRSDTNLAGKPHVAGGFTFLIKRVILQAL